MTMSHEGSSGGGGYLGSTQGASSVHNYPHLHPLPTPRTSLEDTPSQFDLLTSSHSTKNE